MPKRDRGKPKSRPPKIPVTSFTSQARDQLIQADLLGLEAGRTRTIEATRGAFSSRALRAGGGSFSSYMLGVKPSGPPKRPKSSKPRKPKKGSRRR